MWTFFYFIKLFILELFFACVGATIGLLFWNLTVAFLIGISLFLLSFIFNFFLESISAQLHRAKPVETKGLIRSVHWVSDETGVHSPKLFLASDPVPWVKVVRSYFNKEGSILLSQGMINLLNESELRAVIKKSLTCLQMPKLPLQSYCDTLSLIILKGTPRPFFNRKKSKNLSPLNFMGWIFILPWIKFLSFWGGAPKPEPTPQIQSWRKSHLDLVYLSREE